MERQPLNVVHENNTGRHQQLGKVRRLNTLLLVLLELNARVLQQFDTVLCVHVLGEVEFEVELPCRVRPARGFAVLVQEREAQLDDAQEIDVAP